MKRLWNYYCNNYVPITVSSGLLTGVSFTAVTFYDEGMEQRQHIQFDPIENLLSGFVCGGFVAGTLPVLLPSCLLWYGAYKLGEYKKIKTE